MFWQTAQVFDLDRELDDHCIALNDKCRVKAGPTREYSDV